MMSSIKKSGFDSASFSLDWNPHDILIVFTPAIFPDQSKMNVFVMII